MDLMTAVVFFVGLAAGGGGAFFFAKKGTVATEPTVPKPVTSIETNSGEVSKLKQEITNINQKHSNEKKQLEEEIASLKDLQGQLQDQLSNVKTEQVKSSGNEELQKAQSIINSLKNEISQKEETVIALERSEQAMATQIAQLREQLENSQEDVNAHIQNSSSENTKLLATIEEKDKIIEELKSSNTATGGTLANARKPNSEIKLLVVDDSKVVRKQLTNTLKKAGFIIVLAEDGRDALNKLQEDNTFDLVVTDLEMPNVNGHELIKAIHEDPNLKSIPVMAITGHEEISINVVENEGLVGVHKKPWSDEVLIKKIEGLSNLKVA